MTLIFRSRCSNGLHPPFQPDYIQNPCNEIFLIAVGNGTGKSRLGMFGTVNQKLPLNKRVWKNINGVKIPLGKMTRGHIQAAMQWCIARRETGRTKDGYTYDEWISMFLAKLLDPGTLD